MALFSPRSVAGIDLSTSTVKMAQLKEGPSGLILDTYAELRLPPGAITGAKVRDRRAVAGALRELAYDYRVKRAAVSLPEHEAQPSELLLAAFRDAGIALHAAERESTALARALLAPGDFTTSLVIDIGRSRTKMFVMAAGLPRYASGSEIGGHPLTLAVQKHFGVTEDEARRIKGERGITPSAGNEDYRAAMLSTLSRIRDEALALLGQWQARAVEQGYEPIARALLVGGNGSLRGLPEYLESALRVPVAQGDVFINLASRDAWLPPLDRASSLAYGTAIGLALHSSRGPSQ